MTELAYDENSAYTAALLFAENHNIKTNLKMLQQRPPVWIFVDGELGATRPELRPNVIIRLFASASTDRLARTKEEIALMKKLRGYGAQIHEFIGEPMQINGFIITASRYLPGKIEDYAACGKAVANLHNAGTRPEMVELVSPFTPLSSTRQTFESLAKLCREGKEFRIDNVLFPESLLSHFGEYLLQAEFYVETMLAITRERKYPLTILHNDIHMGNVLADSDGEATLIDFDRISAGPAEYDLARPLGQWTQHFKRPHIYAQNFRKGYEEAIHREPDPEILSLALKVSDVYWAAALVTDVLEASQRGQPVNKWQLEEGLRRLKNLHDPEYRWQSQVDRINKRATAK